MLGHSSLPNMFTRSRSATTIGSRVPSAMRGSRVARPMSQRLAGTWQIDAPAVHVHGVWPEASVHETHQALGVRRTQELTHFYGLSAVLLALPAEACASEPARRRRAVSTLLAWVLREKLSRSVLCSARVPAEPRAVGAPYRSPAKGRSNPLPASPTSDSFFGGT